MSEVLNREGLKEFLEQIQNNQVLAEKLVGIFEGQLGELEAEGFNGSIENIKNLGELAHKVKSSAKTLALEGIVDRLVQIELYSKKNQGEAIENVYKEVVALKEESLRILKKSLDELLNK